MSPGTGAREEFLVSEEVGILNSELSTSQHLSVLRINQPSAIFWCNQGTLWQCSISGSIRLHTGLACPEEYLSVVQDAQ
jgi:hypothetical protein